MEDLQDLAIIAERKNDEFIPYAEFRKQLKKMADFELIITPRVYKEADGIPKVQYKKMMFTT